MQKYVAGFLFNSRRDLVILIEKNRPEWQAGLFNAVGGHVEDDEDPRDAMTREFYEEAGVFVYNWDNFLTLTGSDYEVVFYRKTVHDSTFDMVRSATEERIVIHDVSEVTLPPADMVPNLYWILPMAMDYTTIHAKAMTE